MATLNQLIDAGDHLLDAADSRLTRAVKDAEAEVFGQLMKMLDTVSVTDGKLQNNDKVEQFLLTLEDRIRAALTRAGYTDGVYQYVKNFKNIEDNVKAIHEKANGLLIADSQLAPLRRLEVANTIDKLTGSGMAKDFINPVRQSLYRNIMFGTRIGEIEETLKQYVVSNANADSKLMRYVKQVARDSAQQYDGSLQAAIQQEAGLNAVLYVGSLVRDSRPQCRRWVGEQVLLIENLAEEIAWAKANGSGMIPDTTPDTFVIYRGGYNCRHRAIATYRAKK